LSERSAILAWDNAHVWHPYTQMAGWESAEPLVIARASGSRLHDVDGRSYIDANASWWCP
jgi:adenosylmethionine---8-amino-7-oxononanoate aminotransferase